MIIIQKYAGLWVLKKEDGEYNQEDRDMIEKILNVIWGSLLKNKIEQC